MCSNHQQEQSKTEKKHFLITYDQSLDYGKVMIALKFRMQKRIPK